MPRAITMVGGGFIGGLTLAGLMAFAAQAPQPPPGGPATPPAVNPTPPAQARPAANLGDVLVQQLKGVEGCLGVESASLAGGKAVIMAWFENAEAAKRWYYHPMHQRLMFTGNPTNQPERKPLEHVDPDVPIMVIACITFSERPEIPGVPMPISQISIEMYTPLPGGASINGRLTPEAINIEHMRKITPGR